ncbi:phosphatidic acid phosphatase, partial [Candidatus Marinamargulisbacteria bacterium SCGC AG-414-C22]
MKMYTILISCIVATIFSLVYSIYTTPLPQLNEKHFYVALEHITETMIHDIFSPPHASRTYAYPLIAAHEILSLKDSETQSLAEKIKTLTQIPTPQKNIQYEFAAIHTMLEMAKYLVFSEKMLHKTQHKLYQQWFGQNYQWNKDYQRSVHYAKSVKHHMIAWANQDNYNETRTFPSFNIDLTNEKRWRPTPPAYMEGIEPSWNKIRPFIMTSADQFKPPPPYDYDMSKNSPFFNEVTEVYQIHSNLDQTKRDIANFWDCNPYTTHLQGHVKVASKKMTPGGHWIGITGILTKQYKLPLEQVIALHTYVSIALADGFISAWDEKYRSNLIRPENVIKKYFNSTWKPLLETPPFPEYTSAHSVISMSAAVVLTTMLGDN